MATASTTTGQPPDTIDTSNRSHSRTTIALQTNATLVNEKRPMLGNREASVPVFDRPTRLSPTGASIDAVDVAALDVAAADVANVNTTINHSSECKQQIQQSLNNKGICQQQKPLNRDNNNRSASSALWLSSTMALPLVSSTSQPLVRHPASDNALASTATAPMMNGSNSNSDCDCDKPSTLGMVNRTKGIATHKRFDCRDGHLDSRRGAASVPAVSLGTYTRSQLLAVPLPQRKRKTVVYSREFVGPTHIEAVAEEESSTNNIEPSSNCVDTSTINSTNRVDQLVRMYELTSEQQRCATNANSNSVDASATATTTDDTTTPTLPMATTTTATPPTISTTNSRAPFNCGTELDEASIRIDDDQCEYCSSEFTAKAMRTQLCSDSHTPRHLCSHSPVSDEGCAPNLSPYSSSSEDDDITVAKHDRVLKLKPHEKVERSSSSDSALGMDEEILIASDAPPTNALRRMTLTVSDIPLRPALFPIAEPHLLPDSPSSPTASTDSGNSIAPSTVPSKMILEARIVELPPPPPPTLLANTSYYRRFSCNPDVPSSRRESSHSFFGDFGPGDDGYGRSRYVRTPSVVVSDYSDDTTCGITLEELEFLRSKQRKSSDGGGAGDDSDMSAASSCSNLNYCGSTISALDACEILQSLSGLATPERKDSSCSTCSILSDGAAEDDTPFQQQLSDALVREKKKVGTACVKHTKP